MPVCQWSQFCYRTSLPPFKGFISINWLVPINFENICFLGPHSAAEGPHLVPISLKIGSPLGPHFDKLGSQWHVATVLMALALAFHNCDHKGLGSVQIKAIDTRACFWTSCKSRFQSWWMLNNLHLVSAGLSVQVSKEFLHGHVIVNFAAVLLLSMININIISTNITTMIGTKSLTSIASSCCRHQL